MGTHDGGTSPGRRSRRIEFLTLAAVATLASVLIAAGGASTSSKQFVAAIAPSPAAAGATTTLELTLANAAASKQAFGSANIAVPTGITVDASSLALSTPPRKSWAAPVLVTAGGTPTIELRASSQKDSIAAGESLRLTLDASISCSAPRPASWPTDVRQSNQFLGTWNDFVGNTPVLTISRALASFELAPIGSPQEAGIPFSVAVTARDACGDVATDYDGTATVSGLTALPGSAPTPATLSFTDGLAVASVTAVTAQEDARLTVADGAISATSNAFDVVDRLCLHGDPAGECVATDDAGTTTVTTPLPPLGGTMSLTFDAGAATLSCSGLELARRGSLAVIDPVGYADAIPVTLRWDKSVAPGTGVANFVLCMSKDGIEYSVAPACTKSGQLPADTPYCELKRNRNGVGDLVIEVLIHPTDPIAGLG